MTTANGTGHDMAIERRRRPPQNGGTIPPAPSYVSMHQATPDEGVRMNLSLSWAKIGALFAGLSSIIATGITAGWLVLPASKAELISTQTELTLVKTTLQETNNQVGQLQGAVRELTIAVGELRAVVQLTATTTADTNRMLTREAPTGRARQQAPQPRR